MIQKEIEPIKEAKYLYEQAKFKLLKDIGRLEDKLEMNCTYITHEIDNIKEPIQFHINDLK